MTTPIHDSRKTGPRYHVTTRIDHDTITFQKPIDDPFVNHTVHLNWRDMLWALVRFRRSLAITTIVGGDRDVMEAVLELDDNYLGLSGSARRTAFNQQIGGALAKHVEGGKTP